MRIVNIDKPKFWTSFDVVKRLRGLFQERKAGHLGTLDPLATGILPVFLGKATKLIPLFQDCNKTYVAHIELGKRTDTFDAEGKVLETRSATHLCKADIEAVLPQYRGEQTQLAPEYSALKIDGVPAYRLARQGKTVERKSRCIQIHELTLESVDLPRFSVRVHCSKGTYIRSLADDLGQTLGVGAYLTGLERVACGSWFHLQNSVTIKELEQIEDRAKRPFIDPVSVLSHLSSLLAIDSEIYSVAQGKAIHVLPERIIAATNNMNQTEWVKLIDTHSRLIAIGKLISHPDSFRFTPSKVFVTEPDRLLESSRTIKACDS